MNGKLALMINYGLIDLASHHYESHGFKRIESPWLVTPEISDITKAPGLSSYIVRKDNEIKEKVFVASGEQSFLYLVNKGFLPESGRFHTITPCMRNDAFDATHTKYFVKLELIDFDSRNEIDAVTEINLMIQTALGFFKKHADSSKLAVEKTTNTEFPSWDILLDGIEIGSYGYRECLFCNWIYGTGIAEPRFSRLVQSNRKGK